MPAAPRERQGQLLCWYRLERRVTQSQARVLPFEQFYLVPTSELSDMGRVYDVFLGAQLSPNLRLEILHQKLQDYNVWGMTRDQGKTTSTVGSARDKRAVKDLIDSKTHEAITAGDYTLCVPILARRRGTHTGPAYLMNKYMLEKLTEQDHNARVVHSFKPVVTAAEQLFSEMALYNHGKPEIPCSVCLQGLRRVVNPRHCSLGTLSCLQKIKFTGVDSFQDKTQKSVTPQELEENSGLRL